MAKAIARLRLLACPINRRCTLLSAAVVADTGCHTQEDGPETKALISAAPGATNIVYGWGKGDSLAAQSCGPRSLAQSPWCSRSPGQR
jgi:hypothetical protein